MYKVFNMGHRMEIYLEEQYAEDLISVSQSFHVPAQIIGRVEEADTKKLTIRSHYGEFVYWQ
jgi:phosphoribosylformylglycinamidine cyclo-ligase